jgi:AraC-like DNA-binding protein
MAKPRKTNLPEKILKIETEDCNFTPVEKVPEEYQHLLMPAAKVFYTHDYDFDMVCQCIRLGFFSLWTHEIFAMEALRLLPVTCKEIVVLHFMAHGGTKAEIAQNGSYPLNGKEVNLFKLNALFNEAPMKRGDEIFSFHINVLPEDLPKLGIKHPELAQLAKKELMKGSGPLQAKPYKINLVCNYLIKEITECRYIEMQAEKLMYRCCLDLFINFANQDKIAHLPNIYYSDEMEDTLVETVEYIMDHVEEPFNLAKIAYHFDVRAQELRAAFENTYQITMEEFDLQRKMIHAFHMTVATKSSPEEIGEAICVPDTDQFIKMFESYFDCSFITVRRAQ